VVKKMGGVNWGLKKICWPYLGADYPSSDCEKIWGPFVFFLEKVFFSFFFNGYRDPGY
jgi:hypothetical protein